MEILTKDNDPEIKFWVDLGIISMLLLFERINETIKAFILFYVKYLIIGMIL